jgi:hypothetical protein
VSALRDRFEFVAAAVLVIGMSVALLLEPARDDSPFIVRTLTIVAVLAIVIWGRRAQSQDSGTM